MSYIRRFSSMRLFMRYGIFAALSWGAFSGQALAQIPNAYVGTYQGHSRSAANEFVVINAQRMTWHRCEDAEFTVLSADAQEIVVQLPEGLYCSGRILKVKASKLGARDQGVDGRSDDREVHETIELTWYEDRSAFMREQASAIATYVRVPSELRFDHTQDFLSGKTGDKRRAALEMINLQQHVERHRYNEMALRDPDPGVRQMGAIYLRGEPETFVPLLIKIAAGDPDEQVRGSAAGSLAGFYTDNDADGCPYVGLVVANIDTVLRGLNSYQTERPISELLGARISGRTYLPCCMPLLIRARIIEEMEPRRSIGEPSREHVSQALQNIASCED